MKPNIAVVLLTRVFAACLTLLLVLCFGTTVVAPVLAQTESALKGVVVAADGKPLTEVVVYGSVSKRCCPYQQDKVSSDGKGEFLLEHPGALSISRRQTCNRSPSLLSPGPPKFASLWSLLGMPSPSALVYRLSPIRSRLDGVNMDFTSRCRRM
jgi:hypothetical protein